MRFRLPLIIVAVCALPVLAAPPAARWEFGQEEISKLTAVGGVHRDVAGPRPPEFPDFEASNTAVKLDGSGARFTFEDSGVGSPLVFNNGDAITLEAWVNVDSMSKGENQYVIGKGRTGDAGFAKDNQNWALRLRESKGQACISFLFATPPGAVKTKDGHWHRWTTSSGFEFGKGWHHIAVAYKFGEPESVRGWIDGKALPGTWDMGGASKEAPVMDADAVWIGSSQGGNAGNSFRGSLDSIAVHREVLAEDVIKSRYRRVGAPGAPGTDIAKAIPEKMPEVGAIPAGRMLATFHEGMPTNIRWLEAGETVPKETARFMGEEMLLPRLPYRYDEWGIRDSWKAPVLTRLAADINLAPGKHRFLLRARGLSTLWINGQAVARTKAFTGASDGHQPVQPVVAPPLPGARPVPLEMQDAFGEFAIEQGGTCRMVVETLVGGKKYRAEPGELCVARLSDDGKSYAIVTPAGSKVSAAPLTDAAVTAEIARVEAEIDALDDQTRRGLAGSQDEFWKKRHELAREYGKKHPAAAVPAVAAHPIDAFLKAKIDFAVAEAAKTPADQAAYFYKNVRPILQEGCFRCHGDKEKGGLKLNSREAAMKAGESKKPAIVPGDPAASQLLARVRSEDESERMPPKGEGLRAEQIAVLEAWIKGGAVWPAPPVAADEVAIKPVVDDAAFLRRLSFDTRGVPATEAEVRAFLSDPSADKRERVIDRLLADDAWADHWTSYWQDVLAENPNMLKPSLNNTGPFRWFLYESLRDNKPLDRMATELIMLRGSEREGGSAGFGMAADNDAPFAAKGHIVATAFLGIELQCARCHDSPYHSTKQSDLYSLAAMFSRKTVTVPKTSTVPAGFFEKKARESLIKVTLKPGEPIKPVWPFAETTGAIDDDSLNALLRTPTDTRERLAALITSPQNTRFAKMMANRIWRRLIGAGFVEPAHDWEGHAASHPELLDWLATELIRHDYDAKHIARLIFTSQTYQRAATGNNLKASPELRFFAAPERRRMSAEQVVDALYSATGQAIDVEEITFDPGARQAASSMISLGMPRRAWMFASLSNERDRPSLSLPRAQAVTDVLEAFGWTGSRQNPRTDRETDPNVLQPGVLANSLVSAWVTRASQGSALAELAVNATSPDGLIDSVFLRFLNRPPTAVERATFAPALAEGFDSRLVPASEVKPTEAPSRLSRVTWSNHLMPDATTIKMEMEKRARAGTPADPRLRAAWREVYEDFVWSLVNDREFVWLP